MVGICAVGGGWENLSADIIFPHIKADSLDSNVCSHRCSPACLIMMMNKGWLFSREWARVDGARLLLNSGELFFFFLISTRSRWNTASSDFSALALVNFLQKPPLKRFATPVYRRISCDAIKKNRLSFSIKCNNSFSINEKNLWEYCVFLEKEGKMQMEYKPCESLNFCDLWAPQIILLLRRCHKII